jgi:hypothetical protein
MLAGKSAFRLGLLATNQLNGKFTNQIIPATIAGYFK